MAATLLLATVAFILFAFLSKRGTKPFTLLSPKVFGSFATVAGILAALRLLDAAGGATSAAYTCSSLIPEVIRIAEENRAQNAGVAIAGVVEERTTRESSTRISCAGTALLTNTLRIPITYEAHVESDRWLITYQPL